MHEWELFNRCACGREGRLGDEARAKHVPLVRSARTSVAVAAVEGKAPFGGRWYCLAL